MPSITLEKRKGAQCVARLTSRDPEFDDTLVYVDEHDRHGESEIELPPDVMLSVEPTHDKDARDVCMVTGRSGSGKTYWAAAFARRYHELHGNAKPVVMISSLESDATIDKLGFVKRIRLQSLVESPLELAEFPNGGLIMLDDVLDGTLDKATQQAVETTLVKTLSQGRHARISVLVLQHLSSNYRQTRLILHESHYLVYFPAGCSASQMRHTLSYHGGLDNAAITRMRRLPSRWCALKTTFPSLVLYSGGLYMPEAD